MAEQKNAEIKVIQPIVVNLGKQKKKDIKKLKKGEGKLLTEVKATIDEVKGKVKLDSQGQTVLVPIVILYKEKRTGAFRFLKF
jgi:hypothetical protein